jgi:hypothetical protein
MGIFVNEPIGWKIDADSEISYKAELFRKQAFDLLK